MQVTSALQLGRRLLDEHGLREWTVVADRAKTRAGVCRFAARQIGLSAALTQLHSEAEVADTLLHEIAHALVGPGHGHDAVWRAAARRIGSSGQTYVPSSAATVPGAWIGRCPAGHEVTRHRTPQRVVTCGRCSRRFDLTHLIQWTHRGALAPMSAAYRTQLRQLMGPGTAPEVIRVGDVVMVIAEGPYLGQRGEVELVGALRCQVRLGVDLISLPRSAVSPGLGRGLGRRRDRWGPVSR